MSISSEIERIKSAKSSLKTYLTENDVPVTEETKVDIMATQLSGVKLMGGVNVRILGAKGDGVTDDTAAFQTALSQYRCVYVPAGTYKLSDVLTIRDACRLELNTDTVLDFTQTSENCIAMKMSAYLKGNHAVIRVPYEFSKSVIYVASSLDNSVTDVPPYNKWDPQWKTGRYITDVCITKTDSRGFHYSVDGTCSGTAVYIEADSSATSTFIWGLNFSGIRIAGAFAFGIHAKMIGSGWCHEARIEAVIDACEIGVCLEDCNNAYISAAIQPRPALTTAGANIVYAKYGIRLVRSRNTDLSGSRVWDWNSSNTLWNGGTTSGCLYQHIAMVGDCTGTILNDFLYYEMPSYNIRDLIYTDTDSNLEKITILQEPFTRWFKPSLDNKPTFYDGAEYKELCLKETYDATFETILVPNFVNKLPLATDVNGTVYGSNGYIIGKQLSADGNALVDSSGFITTGFIPAKSGDVIRLKGLSFTPGDNTCRLFIYDSSHSSKGLIGRSNLQGNLSTAFVKNYVENDDGSCEFTIVYSGTAYIRLTLYKSSLTGDTPIISVNQELTYSQVGALASGVKVNYAQLTNMPEFLTLATLPKYDGGVS